MTAEQVVKAKQMREAGASYKQIAKSLDAPASTTYRKLNPSSAKRYAETQRRARATDPVRAERDRLSSRGWKRNPHVARNSKPRPEQAQACRCDRPMPAEDLVAEAADIYADPDRNSGITEVRCLKCAREIR